MCTLRKNKVFLNHLADKTSKNQKKNGSKLFQELSIIDQTLVTNIVNLMSTCPKLCLILILRTNWNMNFLKNATYVTNFLASCPETNAAKLL